eukprot:1554654-Rhodomonas_salina.1
MTTRLVLFWATPPDSARLRVPLFGLALHGSAEFGRLFCEEVAGKPACSVARTAAQARCQRLL